MHTSIGGRSRKPEVNAEGLNEGWPSLDDPILAALSGVNRMEWLSPLEADEYAEYRDCDFLERLGRGDLCSALQDFWPARGSLRSASRRA